MNSYLGVSVFFLCIFSNFNKSFLFQNSSVKVIIMANQAVISFCHTLRKKIDGLSSFMETQAVQYLRTFAHPLAILDFGLKAWIMNETA